jgi:hypothetical protein
MSREGDDAQPFVVSPREGGAQPSGLPMAGGTELPADVVREMRMRGVANPDDPIVQPSLRGMRSAAPGLEEAGLPGRIAIVQGQIYIVGVILVTQLVLVTLGLYELLSGRNDVVWWIAGASLVGFLVALVVTLWPRRRVLGQ